MATASIYAVLTGDLVGSTALGARRLEAARAALSEAAGDIKRWRRGLVAGGPDFFRGDAWQMALAEPGLSLRATIYLRASLIAFESADTRIAIGVGRVAKLAPRRVSLSAGEAFERSGRLLDKMAATRRLDVDAPARPGWPSVVAGLSDALIARWTARQAEIICAALDPARPTHQAIAEALSPPVTRQAVSDALAAAQWRAIEEAVLLFEDANWRVEAGKASRIAI